MFDKIVKLDEKIEWLLENKWWTWAELEINYRDRLIKELYV